MTVTTGGECRVAELQHLFLSRFVGREIYDEQALATGVVGRQCLWGARVCTQVYYSMSA